jgi:metallo-beta-lactamase class B
MMPFLSEKSGFTRLGNLSDAVVETRGPTVKKLMETYNTVNIVIPGHGNYGGSGLLHHTPKLVENQPEK